jgi:hypothetical protein
MFACGRLMSPVTVPTTLNQGFSGATATSLRLKDSCACEVHDDRDGLHHLRRGVADRQPELEFRACGRREDEDEREEQRGGLKAAEPGAHCLLPTQEEPV